uniref:uncharacterized protein LOC122595150 isoform X2 n=1 Tax=Erigeron canadensis TaxID=72917 RepID=UPI001CB9C5FB|nr:uncharacterized protein LOC122595150 isoform X2 [Erigeron canadensis]
MSLEIEDDSLVMEVSASVREPEKKARISYSRDFLLSFSDLEICKKLPNGCDQSVLSELEDSVKEQQPRTHGGIPIQGFRRNDYSSSPPTRGNSISYGRWDSRSSGWSDKDSDTQSEVEPDSGRRGFGNQSRRPWQNSEHDGLLGSGSFPRPSSFTGGTSGPKGSTNEQHHLNRSNEAYQPPRPFKAVPHTRPNTHDSFNDETFGSSESTSQDRAEEERKRRASFELMRKEQQKVLQEKQKSSANKLKSDDFSDLILEEIKEEVLELNSAVQSVPKDDPGKSSILLQSSKPRPLVPPGFKSTILEKSSTTKPISFTDKENPKPGIEEIHLLAKGNHTQNGTLDNQVMGISGFPDAHEAVDGEVFQLMANKITENKILSNSGQESTTSILGKFFGSGPTIKDGGSTGLLEQKSKSDDPLSPHNVQSSRFAQWFNEDEKKPLNDISSNRPNDLLSLIGGGDKGIISTDPIAPELSYQGFGIAKTPSDSIHLYNNFRQEPAPPVAAVLTCEDLEQTILSEYSEKSLSSQPPVTNWNVSGQENVDARVVDNRATNHLLSLLQKGTSVDDTSNTNVESLEDHHHKLKDANQEGSLSQNLSLEALFGTAFMKELQSAQAPVSAQRGSAGSARIDMFESRELSVPVMNGPLSSSVDGIGPNMKLPTRPEEGESWLNFDGQRADADPLEIQRGLPRLGKQTVGMGEIQLPEEESLIAVADPANTYNQNIGKLLPSDVAFDISEKLAALNSGFRGGQEGSRFVRGPYDILDPERQFNSNLHGQASSPQMHAAQMNHNRRPMFHPIDPMNSQMRYPEHLNQQFPTRPFQHPDARVTGFDVPVHPQMLPPQMRMQGNFPPNQLLHDLSRPLHPNNQTSNFMPDREAMHGFPFAHQQTNIGGLGMPLPVPDGSSGSNHPEAFQRMMEMELRAQSKQHSQGVYGGPELDMGFRYR